MPPPDLEAVLGGNLKANWRNMNKLREVASIALKNRDVLVPFYELFTAPASHILDRWFESEILKTTLATDAVIGALCSPKHAGSAYVLLHHVMGEAAGKKGVWSYVQGGMGAISNAIAGSAKASGAEIVCNATVKRILYSEKQDKPGGQHHVEGVGKTLIFFLILVFALCDHIVMTMVMWVEMVDGTRLYAPTILSGANPYHTFLELLPGLARDSGFEEQSPLPRDFQRHIRFADYSCGAVCTHHFIYTYPGSTDL
jgi:phytoene dehydrogenase-like protein